MLSEILGVTCEVTFCVSVEPMFCVRNPRSVLARYRSVHWQTSVWQWEVFGGRVSPTHSCGHASGGTKS